VRLGNRDPLAPVVVDPAYFSDEGDMRTMVEGVHMARRLARSGGLGAWRSRELVPGPLRKSEDSLASWIGKNAITTYHFAGTVRMGEDRNAPCDTQLRLRGVKGVRIADASAIPTTPVSALNAPSMLVGWRAASYLLADAG
jgi:choline dehydrogenase